MPRTRLPLSWELARQETPASEPSPWMPATVPGAVQLDWAKAHQLPDYWIGDNFRALQGLDESHWIYRTHLTAWPGLAAGQSLFLVLAGVDYACEVALDGVPVLRHEGMQTPVELDLTARAGTATWLTVKLFPAPKSKPSPLDRRQADHTCKPAVAYTWDFHPRLIPLGFWRETYLEVRSRVHFAQKPSVSYALNESCDRAEGKLSVTLSAPATDDLVVRWQLTAPDNRTVLATEQRISAGHTTCLVPFSLALDATQLWWPQGQGAQALHVSEVTLVSTNAPAAGPLDRDVERIGFRRTRLVMAPKQWDHPATFPKSRSHPPVTLEINGRPIFAKGSNWVCPDIFPGTLTPERYDAQLALVQASHLNILRLWGGATTPHDHFYERCDELGIMVWQEFPLSCNPYPDEADYLALLDQESRRMIARLGRHACVILWSGGNELFNEWSRMTDQSLPLRLLNRNTYDLDPTRPFLPTAPVDGMGHGPYVFRDLDTGEEAWANFQRSACTAYSEFGCPGPAPLATLNTILPEAERWPPRPDTAWQTHHGLNAQWTDSWLHLPHIEHYFGPMTSLPQLVECGQLLQGAGFQGLFEEARRQKPVASIAMNWCFNEPWPCAANNSLVTWPCEPKAALAKVAQACRPTLASARIRKFSWLPGESFDPELWLLHDAPVDDVPVTVTAWLELDGQRHDLGMWTTARIAANINQPGPRLTFTLPAFSRDRLTLHVDVAEQPHWSSTYLLVRARPPSVPLT